MAKTAEKDLKDHHRKLVERVAASPYFAKSARLREMFIYVCDRVLDHEVDEIHEQEVGRCVFGRPTDYDTAADNTVRVHASMLRKRVEQYFANEGVSEPVVIEIPRGNYAPVFHDRPAELAPEPLPQSAEPAAGSAPAAAKQGWQFWLPIGIAVAFAAVSVGLFLQVLHLQQSRTLAVGPTVKRFWAQVFQPNRTTDLVVGDAALAMFEERTGRTVALSEYFDRSYLNLSGSSTAGAKAGPELDKVLLLKRQTNYGDVALLASLADLAHTERSEPKVRFARDYSFREIKADNAILLGKVSSNPWVEPFRSHQTLHWNYDAAQCSYYPVDSMAGADPEKFHSAAKPGEPVEGYAILSLFPNLGGTGSVLIISGTGGTAMNGALGFLSNELMLEQLGTRLNRSPKAPFPYFEALVRIGSRSALPRDTNILIARRVRQ